MVVGTVICGQCQAGIEIEPGLIQSFREKGQQACPKCGADITSRMSRLVADALRHQDITEPLPAQTAPMDADIFAGLPVVEPLAQPLSDATSRNSSVEITPLPFAKPSADAAGATGTSPRTPEEEITGVIDTSGLATRVSTLIEKTEDTIIKVDPSFGQEGATTPQDPLYRATSVAGARAVGRRWGHQPVGLLGIRIAMGNPAVVLPSGEWVEIGDEDTDAAPHANGAFVRAPLTVITTNGSAVPRNEPDDAVTEVAPAIPFEITKASPPKLPSGAGAPRRARPLRWVVVAALLAGGTWWVRNEYSASRHDLSLSTPKPAVDVSDVEPSIQAELVVDDDAEPAEEVAVVAPATAPSVTPTALAVIAPTRAPEPEPTVELSAEEPTKPEVRRTPKPTPKSAEISAKEQLDKATKLKAAGRLADAIAVLLKPYRQEDADVNYYLFVWLRDRGEPDKAQRYGETFLGAAPADDKRRMIVEATLAAAGGSEL